MNELTESIQIKSGQYQYQRIINIYCGKITYNSKYFDYENPIAIFRIKLKNK